jgi:two-component system sensor histidine kinase HydH
LRRSRVTYIPITSIIVGVFVIAAVVVVTSMRDIERGRLHVADGMERKAGAMLMFLSTDLRTELVSPRWQLSRLEFFLSEAANRSQAEYLALLDSDGIVVAHSDTAMVGAPHIGWLPAEDRPDALPIHRKRVTIEGHTFQQYVTAIDIHPAMLCEPPPRQFGRRMRPRCDMQAVAVRLSELLGRPIDLSHPTRVYGVVALDPSEIEATFAISRNRTILLATILIVVGGAAIYFLFVTSAYRTTQTALANMRTYTENVIESMANGLISVDADGHIVTVNSRARTLFGLGNADVVGRGLDDVAGLDPGPESVGVDLVLRGEKDIVEVEAIAVVGGEKIPVSVSASLLRGEDGKRAGAVLLYQDLREIEELKGELERGRHLASLGRLAAGVAHEVRNPLSSIKGFAQFLRSKFSPGSEEERYSDIMIEEVERLDRVVQELLDFAKPVVAEIRPSDTNAIVEDALSLVSEDADFKNVKIVTELAETLPHILVDARQVRQALLNVLLNGMEAMGDGGTLKVTTTIVAPEGGATPASADARPPHVAIEVTDTGDGMSEQEQAKLFEPFYTTKPTGTGLGLTIVSRLVEQNGGHIHVTSTKGTGTTFSMVFTTSPGKSSGGLG